MRREATERGQLLFRSDMLSHFTVQDREKEASRRKIRIVRDRALQSSDRLSAPVERSIRKAQAGGEQGCGLGFQLHRLFY